MLTTAHAPKAQRHSVPEAPRSPRTDARTQTNAPRLEEFRSADEQPHRENAPHPGSGDRPPHRPRERHSPAPPRRNTELVAYCIVEREDAAPTWIRCGNARVNRDGSVNVRLDALPMNGELHLRPLDVRHLALHRVRSDDTIERDASLHS